MKRYFKDLGRYLLYGYSRQGLLWVSIGDEAGMKEILFR